MADHVQVGLNNPYFKCSTCGEKVRYWHNPARCGCDDLAYNYPCKHELGVVSSCPDWHAVHGCMCKVPCIK